MPTHPFTRPALRAALAAAALAVAAPAAQAQSPVRFGLAAGVTSALGAVGDMQDRGYHGLVTLGIKPPLLPVGLRVDGMYNQLAGKDFESLAAGSEPDMNVATVNANITVDVLPLPVIHPYLIGGVGYYRVGFRDFGDTRTEVGYNGGAGFRLALGGISAFVEARYHRVKLDDGEKLEMVPITVGLMF